MATADAAKAIAASIINGDILETTYTSETHVVRIASPYLPLKQSPATTITTVVVGDSTTVAAGDDDGFTFTPFGLERKYPYKWPVGKVTVTYTTGWQAGSEPTNVSEALSMLETWVDSKPELRAAKIEVGDEAVWLRTDNGVEAPPGSVAALLRKWVRRSA